MHESFVFVGNFDSVMSSKLPNVFQNQDMQNSIAYSCSFCYKTFASATELAQHKSVIGGCVEKFPYVCCFCCKRFSSSTELLKHLNHHGYHSVKTTTVPAHNVADCDIAGSSSKDLELLRCKDCNKQFRMPSKLQSHVRSHIRLSQHSCPRCASRCKSARELRTHLQHCHAAVKKYVCDVCDRCFHRPLDLRRHRLSHIDIQAHSGPKTGSVKPGTGSNKSLLHCKDCGADNFKTWRSLTVHRRTRHGGPLPHTCAHCPRRFLYASDLRKHERRHTGQRPHVCAECGKGFFHLADLEVHARAHRGDAPLTCGMCNKWMSSMTGLRGHMQIHRPDAPRNVCSICNKQFSYLSSLRTHMKRQHAGAGDSTSEWSCGKCSAEFSSQSLLQDHITSCQCSMYHILFAVL